MITCWWYKYSTCLRSKIQMLRKKNGSVNWACGFTDQPLVDDDEIEVKTVDLGDVKVLYARPEHHHHDQDDD